MPSGLHDVIAEKVARADVRAARDNQDASNVWDLDRGDIGIVLRRLPLVSRVERDRGVIAVREQRGTARGTEVDALRIAVPAVVTEHAVHGTPRHERLLLSSSKP